MPDAGAERPSRPLGIRVLAVLGTVAGGWVIWRSGAGQAGPLEAAIVTGGWSLSLLPLHATPGVRRGGPEGEAGREEGAVEEPVLRKWPEPPGGS
ncbi:hypothetical protein [Streptomyces sp. AJS327]|uniref:hypothetical protein n=1 Tax=Streptomyces sp. AJS327 TaxID=2545265 RepID=UPI0015E04339|nr:hypothetical protein [Streptomyces sp. AJS327]